MDFREGLTFDDVLLVPKRSPIVSRSQTDLRTRLSRNINLNIPLISANMDTVTESHMAIAIAREGGIGIIHRFMAIEGHVDDKAVRQVMKIVRAKTSYLKVLGSYEKAKF